MIILVSNINIFLNFITEQNFKKSSFKKHILINYLIMILIYQLMNL